MSTELGDAEEKYKKKLNSDDDMQITAHDLHDIQNGGTVYKRIRRKENPYITYGTDNDGDGEGGDELGDGEGDGVPVKIDRRKLLDIIGGWNLKFTKPGKKFKTNLEYLVATHGVQENQKETLNSMIERQIVSGEFKEKGFVFDVHERDIRYDIVDEKKLPDSSAHFIIIRDVSGSMSPRAELAYMVSQFIRLRLEAEYNDRVTRVYIKHMVSATEVSEKGFFELEEDGNTAYLDAYKTVSAMLNGENYKSELSFKRKIDYDSEDVYVLHITDGGNYDDDNAVISEIRKLLPKVTKLMYLQIESDGRTTYDKLQAMRAMNLGKIGVFNSENDTSMQNIRHILVSLIGSGDKDEK